MLNDNAKILEQQLYYLYLQQAVNHTLLLTDGQLHFNRRELEVLLKIIFHEAALYELLKKTPAKMLETNDEEGEIYV